MPYVNVAFPGVRLESLTYEVEDSHPLRPGTPVVAPLQTQWLLGVILDLDVEPPQGITVRRAYPLPFPYHIPEPLLHLGRWMARYYVCPLGTALQPILPEFVQNFRSYWVTLNEGQGRPKTLASLARRQGEAFWQQLMQDTQEGRARIRFPDLQLPQVADLPIEVPQVPTDEQAKALEIISPILGSGRFAPFLVHGVTGSGKTMLYLWLAQKALNLGLSTLILVPEIALTPQLLSLFRTLMGERVVPYHSHLTSRERLAVWVTVQHRPMVVVGPRSALFLPFRDLGLIVVDEEHDPTYKSENEPMYHARDTAVYRAFLERVPIVLGSATPSLESVHNARLGKYRLIRMTKRVRGYWFPRITLIDRREETSTTILSLTLLEHLKQTVHRRKQALLYLNRRGYAPMMLCRKCGYIAQCPECEVSLTYHRKENILRCHLCGHAESVPASCPRCGSTEWKPYRYGTQRVVTELREYFPRLPIARLDLDVRRRKGKLEEIYREMREGRIRILVGTQMIAQGLDFPKVDLVGVLDADQYLAFPDFRAHERTIQRLTQVAGRARRGGLVVVQTYRPEEPPFQALAQDTLDLFYQEELERRKTLQYPPFTRLIAMEFRGKKEEKVQEVAETWAQRLREHLEGPVLGPSPCPLYRKAGTYRYRILIKTTKTYAVQDLIRTFLQGEKQRTVRIRVDVDPVDLM